MPHRWRRCNPLGEGSLEFGRNPRLDEVLLEKTLTYAQAADFLSVPLGTLYSWVHLRKVPHIRISARLVRFDRAELVAWMDERRVAVGRASR